MFNLLRSVRFFSLSLSKASLVLIKSALASCNCENMFLNKHNQEQTKRHSVSEELTIDDFRCLCQFHYDQAISLPHMLVGRRGPPFTSLGWYSLKLMVTKLKFWTRMVLSRSTVNEMYRTHS